MAKKSLPQLITTIRLAAVDVLKQCDEMEQCLQSLRGQFAELTPQEIAVNASRTPSAPDRNPQSRRKLSAKGRRNIQKAIKKRWAEYRKKKRELATK